MKKTIIKGISVILAAASIFTFAACGKDKEKEKLDLTKFPLVYSSEKKGLMMIKDGEEKPSVISEKYHKIFGSTRVKAASNGYIYYVETENSSALSGDLYEYNYEKNEKTLIHSNVYAFDINPDASCIMIIEGSGKLIKYDSKIEKRLEKGEKYTPILEKGVRSIEKVSDDGEYVLFRRSVGSASKTLFVSKTEYEAPEVTADWSQKQMLENKDIEKAPVAVGNDSSSVVAASDDLSVIYFNNIEKAEQEKERDKTVISMFYDYKTTVTAVKSSNLTVYGMDKDNQLFFSATAKQKLEITNVATDSTAKADAKLKKPADKKTSKEYEAKLKRDKIRDMIGKYLENISTNNFYKIGKGMKQASKISTIYGSVTPKGVDEYEGVAFLGAISYDFAAKKPDVKDVKAVFEIFDAIKSRSIIGVGTNGVFKLNVGKEDAVYNSADCFVDTANKTISVIYDFDYSEKTPNVGTLYSAKYTATSFEAPEKITESAASVAHFNAADGHYYITADNKLVKDNEKNVILEAYMDKTLNPATPIVIANSDGKQTAYLITSDKAVKIGDILTTRPTITKASTFAFYTAYDSIKSYGVVSFWNGSKSVALGNDILEVIDFNY